MGITLIGKHNGRSSKTHLLSGSKPLCGTKTKLKDETDREVIVAEGILKEVYSSVEVILDSAQQDYYYCNSCLKIARSKI